MAENLVLSIKEMRQVDARAVSSGIPIYLMMENAGNALAKHMLQSLGKLGRKKIVIVCGLSNNGGGGIAAARHLTYYGADVTVILLGRPDDIRTNDAKVQWKSIEQIKSISKIIVTNKKEISKIKKVILGADGIIDAIFGTGFSGEEVREPAKSSINFINLSKGFIISNDVPSGINADTGKRAGESVRPNLVVVLHKLKRGLQNMNIVAENIGIPPSI